MLLSALRPLSKRSLNDLVGLHGYADSYQILLKNTNKRKIVLTSHKSLLRFAPLSLHTTGFKAVYSCVLPLGILKGCNQYAVVSGFFHLCFDFRTPHDSSEFEWTAWKKTPHTSTPLVQNVTSVDLATGKAHSTSVVNKAVCISEQIRQAHLGLFGFSMLIGFNK
jgi:hypothetical protein